MPEHTALEQQSGLGTALVTGGRGFAGTHLVQALEGRATSVTAPTSREVDLLDRGAAVEAIQGTDVVFHLAAFSSPRLSWEHPSEALLSERGDDRERARGRAAGGARSHRRAGGLRAGLRRPRRPAGTEEAPLRPGNPYAVSKAACDLLGAQYADAYGLHVVRLRPFNHAGPGQKDEYVLSSLARQIAQAEADGASEALLLTGDVSSARDFTDVRDVVAAYVLAAGAEPGEYNVCSGRCVSVAELIEALASESTVPVRHEVDPARLRPNDAAEMRGAYERFAAATGWRPRIPLADTVRDTLAWWRTRLS